jgi:hypothetical protein
VLAIGIGSAALDITGIATVPITAETAALARSSWNQREKGHRDGNFCSTGASHVDSESPPNKLGGPLKI